MFHYLVGCSTVKRMRQMDVGKVREDTTFGQYAAATNKLAI